MNGKMQYTKIKHLIVMVLTLFVAMGIIVGSKTFDVSAADETIDEVNVSIWIPVEGNHCNNPGVITKGADKCEFNTDTSLYNGTNTMGVEYYCGSKNSFVKSTDLF